MNNFKQTSPCHGCVNHSWGCPASSWDEDDHPMNAEGEYIATWCYSSKKEVSND